MSQTFRVSEGPKGLTSTMLKVIIDFDGTLTAEETQARPLAEKVAGYAGERDLRRAAPAAGRRL